MMYSHAHAPQVFHDDEAHDASATAQESSSSVITQENASMSLCRESNMPRSQFACLYTHQKTQKRKVWQDGRLVLHGSRAALHSAHIVPGSSDPVLDQCDVSASDATAINAGRVSDLELDKFLVTIDGPWVSHHHRNNALETKLSNATASASMRKLLTQKYRKPAQQIPPPRSNSGGDQSRKRQRPLQPGELQKKYYGQHLESSSSMSNGDRGPLFPASNTQEDGANHDMSSRGFQQAYVPPRSTMHMNRSAPPQSNTLTFANPQSQQTEQRQTNMGPTSHPPSAKSSTTANEIADNSGYNPSSFYGEEEEEEQGFDDENSPDLFQIPQGRSDTFQPPRAPGDTNPFPVPEQNGEANLFQIPESRPVASLLPSNNTSNKTSDTTEHHGSTLSTSQLLDLFGAGDPTDFTATTTEENGARSQHVSFEKESPAISRDAFDLHDEDEFQLPSDDSSDDEEE